MIARVSSFEGVNIAAAKETMDEAEAIIRPSIEALDGVRGVMQLVADNGKVLAITLFDSGAAATAAEPFFDEELPKMLGHIFQAWEGRRTAVDHYDVVVDARL